MPQFIYRGRVRFCPICDGYEAIDQRIAVIGPFEQAVKKACFLRTYSRQVSLLVLGEIEPSNEDFHLLREADIALPRTPVVDLLQDGDHIKAVMADGAAVVPDVLYPAMGCQARSDLARHLGADHTESDCLLTTMLSSPAPRAFTPSAM